MVYTLFQIFKWCQEKGRHEFKTAEVKHFFNLNSSARFGDWVYFGGLVYKSKKANWGINMERCDKFFKGQYGIPEYVVKNPITMKADQGPDIMIGQVKGLNKFMSADGQFKAEYINNNYRECRVMSADGKTVEKIIRIPK